MATMIIIIITLIPTHFPIYCSVRGGCQIASRYLPEEFKKEEVEEALKVYKKLREILWNS